MLRGRRAGLTTGPGSRGQEGATFRRCQPALARLAGLRHEGLAIDSLLKVDATVTRGTAFVGPSVARVSSGRIES